jgi:phenylalanyl-tRNA synthetase beta chain
MRVPLRWLDEWVPCRHLPLSELVEIFTRRGFPVESARALDQGISDVVVGEVLSVERHPAADRLVLCRVNAGTGTALSIVCGASNVVAGMRAAVALPGAALPGGMRIQESKIRGEISQGMLCSASELGVSEDHEGILHLPPDAPIGTPATEALGLAGEALLELEVHYNRPDVMCVAGVARELAAALGAALRPAARARLEAEPPAGGKLPIRLEDPEGCPRYVGLVLRGARIGPSPAWLRERLERAGVRPIHNVVDVTNYVLLELGQPQHAFDLARLRGPEIRVRRAAPGETLRTLDGRERKLDPENLVIADAERAVALAGVMGGEETEVREATRDLLLESAYFDPYRVQVTANALLLRTEASRRFGRSIDPNLCLVAVQRTAALLEELAGARPEWPVTDQAARRFPARRLVLRTERANALLGTALAPRAMAESLASLGFTVEREDPLEVVVPTHRTDVAEPVDLIEEIARSHGLENLPEAPLASGTSRLATSPSWRFRQRTRRALVGFGFSEVLTPTLGDPQRLALTGRLAGDPAPRLTRLANPPAPEASALRTDLVAGLLAAASRHWRHGAEATRLFEVGTVFRENGDATPTHEEQQVAFLLAGPAHPGAWGGERECDFYDAKGLAEALLLRLGAPVPTATAFAGPGWTKGECLELSAGERPAGRVGRLHPSVSRAWKLERPVYAFVASIEALQAASQGTRLFQPFSRHPSVTRDLAFFLPAEVTHAQVESAIRAAGGERLTGLRLFDVYQGRGVPPGQKSLAFTLAFSHPERTLQESEVEGLQERIVRALAERLGATLRAGGERE